MESTKQVARTKAKVMAKIDNNLDADKMFDINDIEIHLEKA